MKNRNDAVKVDWLVRYRGHDASYYQQKLAEHINRYNWDHAKITDVYLASALGSSGCTHLCRYMESHNIAIPERTYPDERED